MRCNCFVPEGENIHLSKELLVTGETVAISGGQVRIWNGSGRQLNLGTNFQGSLSWPSGDFWVQLTCGGGPIPLLEFLRFGKVDSATGEISPFVADPKGGFGARRDSLQENRGGHPGGNCEESPKNGPLENLDLNGGGPTRDLCGTTLGGDKNAA